VETCLVAFAGAGLGLTLALWVMDLGTQLLSGGSPYVHFNVGIDQRVLSYTVVATLLCVLMAGLTPVRYTLKLDVADVIRAEQANSKPRRTWSRNAFLASQVAASVGLFGCALLFLQSFQNAVSVRPGLDPGKNLAVIKVAPGPPGGALWAEQACERFVGLPGVIAATYARRLPLSGSGGGATVRVEMPNQPPLAVRFNNVAGNYFKVMGTRIVAGRPIDARDGAGTEPVVVVSQMFARQFFSGRNPLGDWAILRGKPIRIIGVAEDAPSIRLHEESEPYLYFPFAQRPSGEVTLIVETASSASALISSLRRELKKFDPAATLFDTTTLRQHIYQALSFDRTMATVSSLLGMLGILLTAAGLFGVVQYAVSRRTRELGLRMALGAKASQIRGLVLRESLVITAFGIPPGFLLLWGLGRYVQSMLLGVTPLNPGAYLLSAVTVIGVTLVAAWLPARRATRIAPLDALRVE
jgi:predicted permease